MKIKKFAKIFAAVFMIAVLVCGAFCFTGCGDDGDDELTTLINQLQTQLTQSNATITEMNDQLTVNNAIITGLQDESLMIKIDKYNL